MTSRCRKKIIMIDKIDVKSLISFRFLSAVIILASSAAILRPAMQKLSAYYEKTPIPVRRPLKDLDISSLPSFKTGWEYKWLTVPAQDIGTEEYALIILKNNKHSPKLVWAELFVTYYCDPEDKVPHTPDVCARQGGKIVNKLTTITLDVPQLPQRRQVKANLLFVQHPQFNEVFIYTFCVEGQFKHSREQVRWVMAVPGNHYAYFSKIEAVVRCSSYQDPSELVPLCKSLICEAIPVLVAEHFPRDEQLRRR